MLEQMRVNDEIRLPHQLAVKVDFRLALLKNYNVDIEQTFRDYKKFRASSKVVGMGEVRAKSLGYSAEPGCWPPLRVSPWIAL